MSGSQRALDPAPLGRTDAVVRDRGDVADRGDLEADRLQRPKRAFAARSGAFDLDLEGADAMLGGLAAGVLGGDLGGIGSRLAAALEAHHPGARPGNRIALGIGDGDHRIVEARIHVGNARRDVLTLAAPDALGGLSHWKFLQKSKLRERPKEGLLLLARDRLGLALAGARIGV